MSIFMQVKRIGIIGLGSIGKKHTRLLKMLNPDFEIYALSSQIDLAPEIASLLSDRVETIDALIDRDLQAAFICSPAPFHLAQAQYFLNRKIPVFIEKPLSISMQGLRAFQELVTNTGVCVAIGYVLRFRPDLLSFCKAYQQGTYGKAKKVKIVYKSYLPNWRPGRDFRQTVSANRDSGGGVLLELSHELDYLRWIFGEVASVKARLNNLGVLNLDVEEQALLEVKTQSGLTVEVDIDFISEKTQRYCQIENEQGLVTCDLIKQRIQIAHEQNSQIRQQDFDFTPDFPFLQQLKQFLNSIQTGAAYPIGPQEGIETMRLISASKEAAVLNSSFDLAEVQVL